MKQIQQKRLVIENVHPEIDGGRFPIKRKIGEKVLVQGDIFTDGDHLITAECVYRYEGEKN